MNVQPIPPQEVFFYEGNWNEASANTLIQILLEDKEQGCWIVNGDNEAFLLTALEFLNEMKDHNFNYDEVVAQHNMLKKRYLTFKAILEVEGVHWDKTRNHVYVFADTWRSLIKANVFAKAYFHKGDIMHDQLKQLFGYEHDISNEIIQLSLGEPNKCMPNSSKAPILVGESDDEQEVESPLLGYKGIPP